MQDIQILRALAARYAQAAFSDENLRNMAHHRAVNDNQGARPIVLVDEIPWFEMQVGDELTLRCKDPALQRAEWYFRRMLYCWQYMRADMALPPFYGVKKQIKSGGNGIERLFRDDGTKGNTIQAHTFQNQFQCEADLEKLHNEVISYDEAATRAEYERVANVIGDVLPVKIVGEQSGYSLGCVTWDLISNYCGLDTLFLDLLDKPKLMHALANKLTDIYIDKVYQYEALNLLEGESYTLHCTAGLTNDLTPERAHPKLRQMWGRGTAQILGSVSPEMHDEFDIQYMVRAMEPFGLTYYGCCEPLDGKIDILEKLPNLRKISVTPWANVDVACERIAGRHVVASKPNPSAVAVPALDEAAVRAELERIVDACYRNNCSCDMVLKDITTVCSKPQTLWRWVEIAMETVRKYG